MVIVSRDGWVKRQKEVRDLSATRLREGDSVLAVLPGAAAAACSVSSSFRMPAPTPAPIMIGGPSSTSVPPAALTIGST